MLLHILVVHGHHLAYIPGCSKFSLAYSGYAELACFLYFGLVATLTIPILFIVQQQEQQKDNEQIIQSLQLQQQLMHPIIYAIQIGCHASAILVVNNLRDRKTDAKAYKNTLVVQYGRYFGQVEYTMLIMLPYMLLLVDYYYYSNNNDHLSRRKRLLPMLSLPVAMKNISTIYTKDGAILNSYIGKTALLQLLFSFFICISWY